MTTEFERSIIHQYVTDLKELLLRPKSFFARVPVSGGLGYPLAFTLVTHWIGMAAGHLWRSLFWGGNGTDLLDRWLKMMGKSDTIDSLSRSAQWMETKQQISTWLWGTGTVILDPFMTLVSILITSFFVFLGARILVPQSSYSSGGGARVSEATYESAVRVVAYGACATIFSVIPGFGTMVAWIYGLYLSIVAARTFYGIRTGRAAAVVLFPKLLVVGFFFTMIFGVVLLVLKFFMASM